MWEDYGGLLLLGWIGFIILYNNWLIAKRNISALRLGRILIAALDIFLWIPLFESTEFSFAILGVLCLAALILFTLLALNYHDSQSLLHAILMTLVQLTGGIVLIMLWFYADRNRKRKDK